LSHWLSDDYSSLTDLHVYGDLLTLYSYRLPGSVSIAEAGRLYNELLLFERRLLTLYVSYVLAAAGFYDSVTAEVEGRYTTKFSDKDGLKSSISYRQVKTARFFGNHGTGNTKTREGKSSE
jgi:hypothetical protein